MTSDNIAAFAIAFFIAVSTLSACGWHAAIIP
jgi:hypothetical protein